MKNKLLLGIFMFVVFIVFVTGCRTASPPAPVLHTTDSVVYREKLVPVAIAPDSSYIEALFECDSTNRVIMLALNEAKSRRVSTTSRYADGVFRYRAIVLHDTVYVRQRDTARYRDRQIYVPVDRIVPKDVNRLYWWQLFLCWSGAILWVLILYVIYSKLKKAKPWIRKN